MRRAAAGVLGLILLVLPGVPAALASNGAAAIAIGGRAAGRGGADAALADDAISLQLNPAGMLRTRGLRLDLQNMVLIGRDRLVNERNDSLVSAPAWFVPAIGAILDPAGPNSAFRIGFALTTPFGAGGERNFKTEVYPEGEVEELAFWDLRFGPALAWRPAPPLRLGIGAFYNLLYLKVRSATTAGAGSANGVVRVHYRNGAPVVPPEPIFVNGQQVTYDELFALATTPDSNSASLYKLSSAFGHGFSLSAGAQWDVTPALSVGLAYSSPTFFTSLEGDADIDATSAIAAINADPDFSAIAGALLGAFMPDGQSATFLARYRYRIEGFALPQSISAGLAFWPAERLNLSADLRWYNWADAFSTLDVKLEGGTNRNINEINGGDGIETRVELEWKNMLVAAAGVSFAPTERLTLRAGYNYSTNPIRKNRAGSGAPFYDHHLAGGLSFFPWPSTGITAAVVYALPVEARNDVHPGNPAYSFTAFKAEQLFIYFGLSLEF